MSVGAHVGSLEALRAFRTALAEFRSKAKDSLLSADVHTRRLHDWLGQRLKHWQREHRVRQEEFIRAKGELSRREQFKKQGGGPGTADQEKAYRIAQARLKEAEVKIKNCKRWQPLFDRALHEYHAPAHKLSTTLDSTLVRSLALLDEKLAAIEAYLTLTTPTTRAAVPGPLRAESLEPPHEPPSQRDGTERQPEEDAPALGADAGAVARPSEPGLS